MKEMKKELIAPCGMNCRLCYAYQREKNHCNGCNGEDQLMPKSCQKCIIRNCTVIQNNSTGYCFECDDYPCKRLKNLDARYKKKYHMSMIENLKNIKTKGIEAFLEEEEKRWTCSNCHGIVCIHKNICLECKTPLSEEILSSKLLY